MDAVLLDLDGLLVDTEPLHTAAYQAALREVGVELSEADYEEHWIRRGLGIAELCAARGWPFEPGALRARKGVFYAELVRSGLRTLPGAPELIARLAPSFALAIATSSGRDAAEAVLAQVELRVPVVVTGSDVARPKPHPDGFLEAARRLGVSPARCVVLEDAEKGVLAAVAAEMRVIAVPTALTACHDFSRADLVLATLDEVTVARVRTLLARDSSVTDP